MTHGTAPVIPLSDGAPITEDGTMDTDRAARRGAPVTVACRFGAAGGWRPCRIVGSGPRSVTVEPWALPGELGRAVGPAVIRLRFADGTEVEILGTIRRRSWLDERRFGLGVECSGFRVSVRAVGADVADVADAVDAA